MYELLIANKNYSSWSLRPWVLMRTLGIPFKENLLQFPDQPCGDSFAQVSPNGLVPCLVDGDTRVWESLAIIEYLAERHPGVWPEDPIARAWARSASAEMHAGFGVLREVCSMNCGLRVRLHQVSPALARDLSRIEALWNEGLARFGGPYLAGARFTGVDAFFAPVAFRIQTFGLVLGEVAMAYGKRLLALPEMQAWYASALAETWRDEVHEADTLRGGVMLEDLRAT